MRNWNLSTKIVLAFSALITLTAGSLTYGQYSQLQLSLRQSTSDRLLEIMQLAEPQIDSDYHSLVVQPKDSRTAFYQSNTKQLQQIQAASKDIQRIYTVRQQKDGGYTYVLDYGSDGKPPAQVGDRANNLPPLLVSKVSIKQAQTEQQILSNHAGVPVLYGYVPITDRYNRQDGLLVVELDARSILKRELEAKRIALVTFIGILLLTLGVVWWLAQSLVVRPTLKLNEVVKRLTEGQWDETLPTERRDELGTLARSFNHMAQQLKTSFQELESFSQNLEHQVGEHTRKLSESEQLLNLVMNNIPQSIFWKNREGVYQGCNKSFAQVAGMVREDMVGKTDYELPWKKEEADFFVECDRRVMNANVPELGIVEPQLQADGSQHWLETSKVPLHDNQGNVVGIIGIFQDITPYKEAEKAAQQANQAKSDFLANMSHELRTPLNGILGYAQILGRSAALPDKERRGVNIIHQCGAHLLNLINDVLDLSKIEARKLELSPTALHLPSLIQGVVEICQIRADQKGIDFRYEPDEKLPAGVMADEKRLRQVLINLLGNAIKFTDKGGVTLKAELRSDNAHTTRIGFSVIDTGVGIAPQHIDKLFQAFEQVGDKTRQAEGTGLGLAISQQIVQLMGGQIQVKSQLGDGSEFFFELDLPLALDWNQQQAKATNNIVGYQGEKRKILVVDDRWENRSVLLNLLEPIGFHLLEAANGKEGLEQLQTYQPDLVITDIAMPVMNGFELLKQIRQSEAFKHLKVLVSSASVAQTDQQMAYEAGGDDFLPKPVPATVLFQQLEEYLNLNWVYEDPEQSHDEMAQANSAEMIPPPLAMIEELLSLAQKGRFKKFTDLVTEIKQQDSRFQVFAEKILHLAQQYQFEKIEEQLRTYLKIESTC
ncbi:MAG: ATP-binding protein [Synechococcales bacterium]|nr:ATP-binding protein [Synechococcales bacterium]